MTTGTIEKQPAATGWVREFDDLLRAGRRCFVLTFNTDDYVQGDGVPTSLPVYLRREFYENRGYDLVVTFSISEGVQIEDRTDERERQLNCYSGLHVTQGGEDHVRALVETLRGLTRLLLQDTVRVAVILKYGEHIAPAVSLGTALSNPEQMIAAETLHHWSINSFLPRTDNVVLLFAREGHYHELINQYWSRLSIPLPGEEERLRFLQALEEVRNQRGPGAPFAALEDGLELKEAVRLSTGLRLRSLEELSRVAGAQGTSVTRQAIRKLKAAEIRRLCDDLLEVLPTDYGFEAIGGSDHVKAYLGKMCAQIRRGGRNVPRAILFVGVPGVGKSYLVRALAREIGFNCVSMRAVRSMWVGESERNLERVINALTGLKPLVLFQDEIDQTTSRRSEANASGDSGTSERMQARLWEFMALDENRGSLIFVGASNRPDLLDAATVDRFGVTIPFLPATTAELAQTLPLLARQIDVPIAPHADLHEVARVLHERLISTRQALDVLADASLNSDVEAGKINTPVSESHLLASARAYQPNVNPLAIERISLQAVRMTSLAHLNPWAANPESYEYPEFLKPIVDPKTGDVDRQALDQRLQVLRRVLA